MNENNLICKICNNEFENNKLLAAHIRFKHKMKTKDYYDIYLKKPNEGICACPGCNKPTKYYKLTHGYAKHCSNKCQIDDVENKEKIEQTMLERYNAKNNFIRKDIIIKAHSKEANEKRRQTNLNKRGVEYTFQSPEVLEKSRQTNQLRYNVDYGCMTPQCRAKANSSETISKKQETFFKHYGAYGNLGRTEIWKKTNDAQIKHYDKPYFATEENRKNCNSLEARRKAIKTKKKNKTLNSSSYEKDLTNFFISHNITYEFEYVDNIRYPYHCDFYLLDLDLFIELNIHWTHNTHFFDKNNPNDIATLNKWQEKSKTSNFYKTAIEVWTKRDIEKHNCAIKNNLNYITLWNKEDIEIFKQFMEVKYGKKE